MGARNDAEKGSIIAIKNKDLCRFILTGWLLCFNMIRKMNIDTKLCVV